MYYSIIFFRHHQAKRVMSVLMFSIQPGTSWPLNPISIQFCSIKEHVDIASANFSKTLQLTLDHFRRMNCDRCERKKISQIRVSDVDYSWTMKTCQATGHQSVVTAALDCSTAVGQHIVPSLWSVVAVIIWSVSFSLAVCVWTISSWTDCSLVSRDKKKQQKKTASV